MKQVGYLFTVGITSTRVVESQTMRGGKSLQTWDSCASAIIYGADLERAQDIFEDWCLQEPPGEDPAHYEIKKLVAAEIIAQLLTESGSEELDWQAIQGKLPQPMQDDETPDVDEAAQLDLSEGYWVNINQVIGPDCAQRDLESLKCGLPEDIRSGLNWSPDRKFIFLVSSLSPQPAAIDLAPEVHEPEAASDESGEQEHGPFGAMLPLEENVACLPEMREKEAAALIKARNSVVAAWLWWRYAANTHLVANEILVSPCCQIIAAE